MADTRDRDMNRDPITGEPGSHPIGTGGVKTGDVDGETIKVMNRFGSLVQLIGLNSIPRRRSIRARSR